MSRVDEWFEQVGRFYGANGDFEGGVRLAYEDGARESLQPLLPLLIAARDSVRQDAEGRRILDKIIGIAATTKEN